MSSIGFMLKSILFQLIFFFWVYRLGVIVTRWFPDFGKSEKTVFGFILGLSFFQILATPVLAFHLSFDLMYYPMLVFILLSIAISFHPLFISTKNPRITLKPWSTQKSLSTLAVILVLAQGLAGSYLQHPDGDDSYYIGTILTNYYSDSVLRIDPASGLEGIPPQGQYSFQGWEMLLGVFSRVLDVQPAAFAHTILPFSLIVMSYLAFYILSKRLIPESQHAMFIILISVFHFFAGYAHYYSAGSYLYARIWQGKSLLYLFIFPCLYAVLKGYLNTKASFRHLALMVLITFAAFSLNPISIYLVPLLVFSVLLPEAIRNKQVTPILKALVILIPFAFYAFFIRNRMSGSFTFNNPDLYVNFSSIVEFTKVVIGGGYFYLLYIGVLVFLILRKSDYITSLLLFSPLILLVFVWNPLTAPLLAKYLTSYPTYWRVFWLLPLGIGISTTGCLLIESMKTRQLKILTAITVLLAIAFSGSWIFQSKYSYSKPENIYKLPAADLQVVNALIKFPD